MKLQILIPTLPERKEKFDALMFELKRQIRINNLFDQVKICVNDAPKGVSIGLKRNELLQRATADYVAFIDDDDNISPDYIERVMEGISKGVDACSLRGIITIDGGVEEVFEHSIRYSAWKTNDTGYVTYERYHNHLNTIKREIAQQFKFPETNFGEDHDWSTQIFNSGLIKTEHYIDSVIYNYVYISSK